MSEPKAEATGSGPAAPIARKPTVFSAITIRNPPYTYFCLSLIRHVSTGASSSAHPPPLDEITVRMHLTSALSHFLGLTGTAIPIDILKVEGRDAWIRAPSPDASAVSEALSGWVGQDVGWRIKARGCWLGGLTASSERELFED